MPRTNQPLKRRAAPTAKRSKIAPLLLGAAIVIAGFSTLMVRLEITQEGYRLSSLAVESRTLEERNRRLKLEVAELSSHDRLRALALKDGMGPPPPDHVVILP